MADDNKNLYGLYVLLIFAVYMLLVLEAAVYVFYDLGPLSIVHGLILKLKNIAIYSDHNIVWSKVFIYSLLMIVSLGSRPKKQIKVNVPVRIILPLVFGTLTFFGSAFFYFLEDNTTVDTVSKYEILYLVASFLGAILVHTAFDNISKIIHSNLLDDPFNHDNESFEQPTQKVETDISLNLPMTYYHRKKNRKGWFNLTNPFRGTMVIGTPESGKSFSIIFPFIRTVIKKNFTAILYDVKYPELSLMAYYHYLIKKKENPKLRFHIVDLNNIEQSRRVNPLKRQYLPNLSSCIETAEGLVNAMRKGAHSSGPDKFFTDSAINLLSAVIFFLSRYENGKYSTLPHVLSLLNRSYEEIFDTLYSQVELHSILSPFQSAYENKAWSQLEGQVGTLKINISRLATPETYWVFSGDDFDLHVSNKKNPSILIIANTISTQNVNSSTYSLLLNRLVKLVNSPGNEKCAIVVDEVPTLYFHQLQNLIATARSNKVAVMLGLQEIPQLYESFGKTVADTLVSVIGNVVSGAVRKKETMEWLEKLFGKYKQLSKGISIQRETTTTSINEKMDSLIPASKIAQQTTGHVVAQLAFGFNKKNTNLANLNTYNCKIEIDTQHLKKEEARYVPLPFYYKFRNPREQERILRENMLRINNEIDMVIHQ